MATRCDGHNPSAVWMCMEWRLGREYLHANIDIPSQQRKGINANHGLTLNTVFAKAYTSISLVGKNEGDLCESSSGALNIQLGGIGQVSRYLILDKREFKLTSARHDFPSSVIMMLVCGNGQRFVHRIVYTTWEWRTGMMFPWTWPLAWM
jgi:hypothetical protein